MHMTLDYRIVGPGMFMTATSYGLGRYAYGLFIPTFRDAFSLTDTRLALIASFSYGSYFLVTLIGNLHLVTAGPTQIPDRGWIGGSIWYAAHGFRNRLSYSGARGGHRRCQPGFGLYPDFRVDRCPGQPVPSKDNLCDCQFGDQPRRCSVRAPGHPFGRPMALVLDRVCGFFHHIYLVVCKGHSPSSSSGTVRQNEVETGRVVS